MAKKADWTATSLSFTTENLGLISTGIVEFGGTTAKVPSNATMIHFARTPINKQSDAWGTISRALWEQTAVQVHTSASQFDGLTIEEKQEMAQLKFMGVIRSLKEYRIPYIQFNKSSCLYIVPHTNSNDSSYSIGFDIHLVTCGIVNFSNDVQLAQGSGGAIFDNGDNVGQQIKEDGSFYFTLIANPLTNNGTRGISYMITRDASRDYDSLNKFITRTNAPLWEQFLIPPEDSAHYKDKCMSPFKNNFYVYGTTQSGDRLYWEIDRYYGYGSQFLYNVENKSIDHARSWIDTLYVSEISTGGGTVDPGKIADGAGGWLSNILDAVGDILEKGLEANKSDIIKRGNILGFGEPSGLLQFCVCNTNELAHVGSALWNMGSKLTSIFSSMKPTDYIIKIGVVPLPYEEVTSLAQKKIVKFGTENAEYKEDLLAVMLYLNQLKSELFTKNCGSISIPKFYDNALDYKNTKVSIYLPYCGEYELDIDRIIDGNLKCTYYINLFTGDCLAELYFTPNTEGSLIRPEGIVGLYSGNCMIPIPFASGDNSNILRGIAGTIGGLATVGIGAATGNPIGIGGGVTQTVNGVMQASANTNMQIIGNSVGNNVSAYFGPQKPYLIFKRANQCLPSQYGQFNGYPTEVTMQLSECNGFTKVQSIYLNNLTCTADERAQIESLLKDGIYI